MADNVAIVKGVYEAFTKGDINTVLGALDEQIEWHQAEHNPYWPGKAFCGAASRPRGCHRADSSRLRWLPDGCSTDRWTRRHCAG